MWYGEQDHTVHLRRYEGGYPALKEVMNKLKEYQAFVNFCKARSDMFLSRILESVAVGVQFLEWADSEANTYEFCSNQLWPGAVTEQGNYCL